MTTVWIIGGVATILFLLLLLLLKGRIESVEMSTSSIRDKIVEMKKLVEAMPTFVTCSKCGCAVRLENATAGKDRIEIIRPYYGPAEKIIINDWFCKTCAPKKVPGTTRAKKPRRY